jgi:Kef-type K+ transport system membrane component KefB
MNTQITELALLFGFAALVGILARMFQQPMLLAYLVAGFGLAAFGIAPATHDSLYQLFSQIGVMLLLFMIGLEINYSSLKVVGKSIAITSIVQVALSGAGGMLIGLLFGWSPMTSAFAAVLTAFGSTVVVVKVLGEQHELQSLHGKLAIGILLTQDVLAMLLLVGLTPEGGNGAISSIMWASTKVVILFALTIWGGRVIMPRLLSMLARTPELLFMVSIAWLFLVAAAVHKLGLSIEIGGLLAGLALANSAEQLHIASRMRPLRDFFLALFFIMLGASLSGTSVEGVFWPVVALSVFVLLINPLIVMFTLMVSGYHRRTAFMTGGAISQISEFSLIVAAAGVSVGYIDQRFVTVATLSAMVTIGASVFFQHQSDAWYHWVSRFLSRFEHVHAHGPAAEKTPKYATVVIGGHRLGQAVLRSLSKKTTLVIDFDPEVLQTIRDLGYHTSYGDLSDEEMLENVVNSRPKLVICTSPNVEDTVLLLQYIRHMRGKKPTVVVRAEHERDTKLYYDLGADYVIQPHITSGTSLGEAVQGASFPLLKKWKTSDLQRYRKT